MKSAEVLALRFGEPMKRAQSGDAAHRSAAASSNGFEVEEGRGRRYTRSNFPPYLPFFPTYFLQECNIVLKIHAKKGNIVRNFHIPGERSIQTIGGHSVVERILQDRSCLLS